jgi:Rrf2 family transcriptional regulator, cysteine metabolism repressor
MKLSRTIAYAVQATIGLSHTSRIRPVSSRQLAIRGHMPERFLLQIMRDLVSHGVVCSTIGVSGGYWLARSPAEISLCQIIGAFEDSVTSPSIPELPGITPLARERLLACVAESTLAARQHLEKLTLADLIQSPPSLGSAVSGNYQFSQNSGLNAAC